MENVLVVLCTICQLEDLSLSTVVLTTSPARLYVLVMPSRSLWRPPGEWLTRAVSSAYCSSKTWSIAVLDLACRRRKLKRPPSSRYRRETPSLRVKGSRRKSVRRHEKVEDHRREYTPLFNSNLPREKVRLSAAVGDSCSHTLVKSLENCEKNWRAAELGKDGP